MKEKLLDENIDRLNISCKLIELLKDKKITKIQHICKKAKTDLKDLGIDNKDISKIAVELQLLGLDLKNNY